MGSRRDQLQSHQFLIQRVVSALVLRDTDPAGSPLRRSAGAGVASVLLAAVALGGVAGYGLLRPGGNTRWQSGPAVIVEKETGARYVHLDGVLHPVLNYTSARLIIGADADTVSVSRDSLAGVPRGATLGIPDAPDALPRGSDLLRGTWQVCTRREADETGTQRASTVLVIGQRPTGGRPLTDQALLAAGADGTVYLIWHGHRHLVRDAKLVLPALGFGQEQPVPVGTAWLTALPAGADLGRVPVARRGTAVPALPGARVGQVFVSATQGGSRQFYLVQPDGLAPITQVQADILLGDPDTARAYPGRKAAAISMPPADAATAPRSASPVGPAGDTSMPTRTPTLARPATDGGTACAVIADARSAPEVVLDAAVPGGGLAPTGTGGTADKIRIGPGHGVLVEAMSAPDATGGALSLVSDQGERFPLSGPEAVAAIGYRGIRPVRLPASVVALLPSGPALDPAAARAVAS